MREFETYYLYDVNQGGCDWLYMRKGRITASVIGKIVGHAPYNTHSPAELAAIIKGEKWEVFSDEAKERMKKGNDYEPFVRDHLAKVLNTEIKETGFAIWKADTRFGASLDGIIDDDTGIEIKCPAKMYAPIKEYMDNKNRKPDDYSHIWKSQMDQMVGNAVITGRKNMIFAVYAYEENKFFYQNIKINHSYWYDFLYPTAVDFFEKYMK